MVAPRGSTSTLDSLRLEIRLGKRVLWGTDLPAVFPTLTSVTPEPFDENVFQLRGDFWQATFSGETKFLKDSAGMSSIARLLAQPGRDVPAVTLLAARAGIDPLVTQGTTEPFLDELARAAYQSRYESLMQEIAEATRQGNQAVLTEVQEELRALSEELSRATGLSGNARHRSDADRVRKSVSMAVARSIAAISQHHPKLGHHIQVSISAGLVFRYDPAEPIALLT